MPDNASGFIDFNQFSEMNSAEEQRLMEQAVQRAQESQAKAKAALAKAGIESRGRYGADGQISGETSLSSTASYSDYLKASKEASDAWAAVTRRSTDPRLAALQSATGKSGRERAQQAGLDLRAQESRLGQEADAGAASLGRQRGQRLTDAEAAKKAADERTETEQGWREAYIADVMKGAKARGAAGGTQRNYVGSYNPYASSTWAQQQGAFEAQQLKNAGGSDAQQRGVWDAYTAKGSGGAGLAPKDRYQPMYREMQPFKPDEEE